MTNLLCKRENYVAVTFINFLIVSFFGLLLFKFTMVDNYTKYEFLDYMKKITDNIFGEYVNKYYIVYLIFFIHGLYSLGISFCLFTAPYLDIYVVNLFILMFVMYTNLEYRGCLLRKYEKMFFTDDNKNIDPGAWFPHLAFKIIGHICGFTFNKEQEILTVFFGAFIMSIAFLIKLLYLIYKND